MVNDNKTGSRAIIRMKGRFDFNVHRSFKEQYDAYLKDPAIHEIEVDLSGVEYMDSSALGMLLMLRDRATSLNKTVRLSNPNSTVSQILEIANFSKLFSIN